MNILSYIQIILAVLLTISILLQQRGTGLSGIFGGSSLEYSTKRGVEKFTFYSTIVLAILFVAALVAQLILPGGAL